MGQRDPAWPEDLLLLPVAREYHAGLTLRSRIVQEGKGVPFTVAVRATQDEALEVGHDPPFGVLRIPRWWGCPQAQHLFPAADVVGIYKHAIVRSHPRRGVRWFVPLVLRRSCRILENTNPGITRELRKQMFAQGSMHTTIYTAGTIACDQFSSQA